MDQVSFFRAFVLLSCDALQSPGKNIIVTWGYVCGYHWYLVCDCDIMVWRGLRKIISGTISTSSYRWRRYLRGRAQDLMRTFCDGICNILLALAPPP